MIHVIPSAAVPAAATTYSGQTLSLPACNPTLAGSPAERERMLERARGTDALRQLQRIFSGHSWPLRHLSWRALVRLAANEPVNPNQGDMWLSREEHAAAVLRRHGINKLDAAKLTQHAVRALIDGQADLDRDAGLDWSKLTGSLELLDEPLRQAHAKLPIDLQDAAVWMYRGDQRRALGDRLGVDAGTADDLSRWVLANPGRFDPKDLQSWRIGSPPWLELADEQLEPVHTVTRPVGLFVVPALTGDAWQLLPVLSLDAIRLFSALGGRVERDLSSVVLRRDRIPELLARINVRTLHAGPKENVDSAGQLAQDLSRMLGHQVSPGVPQDKRDRWGRLHVSRLSYRTSDGTRDVQELRLRVWTLHVKGFGQRRLGAQRIDDGYGAHGSAVMELGEAVHTAVERELPLLLSTEAAGQLKGKTRVGRPKGRPGMVTITSSDGLSASTRSLVAEQAVPELRKLKAYDANVTLDAGARQLIRMVLAKPLADDPVLLGPQREVAALKVLGSGLDASMVGCGKTITTARAIAHRATVQPRFRGLLVADGRLLRQWQEELRQGARERGMPPLTPNVQVLRLAEDAPVAAQLRKFDRELGDGAGLVLASNSVLDRYPTDLQALKWHLMVGDEAARLTNPSTDAHQAFAQVRFGSVADCWLLTATPMGKTVGHLDVLIGLSIGDGNMVRDRLNTREGGDLMGSELNAQRVRSAYGPYLTRVTRAQMVDWLPKVAAAKPLAIEPDPALKELLDAIRNGGRDAFRRLLNILAELKTLQRGTELHKAALAELARVQGVVLGNVGTFCLASTDPEALLHSDAAIAQALVRQGVVERAVVGGGDGLPTLRGIVADTIAGVVGRGHSGGESRLLVFAERVWPLRLLADTLRDRHGIDTRVGTGALSASEFDELKRAYNAGEFPVFCLSPVAHTGLNLPSEVIVHLDAPWTPGGLDQRVGRAARMGARGDVFAYWPSIRGGGVEHQISILSPRAAEQHAILDGGYDGVPIDESTVAMQQREVTSEVAESRAAAGYEATAARLRVAAAVFGG